MLANERKKRKQLLKKPISLQRDDEVNFNKMEEKEDETLFCLMALEDEEIEVYDISLSSSNDNDIDDLYSKLYESLLRTKKE